MAWPLFVAAGAALGAGWRAFQRGVPVLTVTWRPEKKLTAQQLEMAQLILEKFRAAGYSDGVTLAAIANAWAESRLNPLAHAPGGEDSVGLFQLNARGKAPDGRAVPWYGATRAERENPERNIGWILDEIGRYYEVSPVDAEQDALGPAFRWGAPLSKLAAIFSRDIERPGDKTGAMRARAAIVADLWGEGAAGTPSNLVRAKL